ncbi:hypothetical protein KC19_VG309700, partial [Ceratodon purpureus]
GPLWAHRWSSLRLFLLFYSGLHPQISSSGTESSFFWQWHCHFLIYNILVPARLSHEMGSMVPYLLYCKLNHSNNLGKLEQQNSKIHQGNRLSAHQRSLVRSCTNSIDFLSHRFI